MPFRSQDMKTSEFPYAFAQLDIRSASGHIGGNGHGLCLTGPGDNLSLPLVMFGIEH